MSAERIAADRIARAVEKGTGRSMDLSAPIGRAAVEMMSAAGLVVLTAERAQQLLAAERERDEARFAPMGDNHHNAALCPYCNPTLKDAEARTRAEALEPLGKLIANYFAPWGSWKTSWWEREVGDHQFTGDNLLREIKRRIDRQLATGPKEAPRDADPR